MFGLGIRLTATGIDDALDRLDGLERAIRLAIVVELERWGRVVTEEMIQTHSFQNITGRLERSIGYTVEEWRSNAVVLTVSALAPYAEAVETGTPNSRPYPFFWPSFYKYLPDLEPRLAAAIAEAIKDYSVS